MNAAVRTVALVAVSLGVGGYVAVKYFCPAPTEQVYTFPGAVACPDHSSFDAWNGTPGSTTTAGPLMTVAIAGEATTIPEFHDCQRLIDSRDQFGTLAAIWVPPYLQDIGDSAMKRVTPAAVIHAWDGNYATLGIRQGWNCLYLFGSGDRYTAYMVPVATDTGCARSTVADSMAAGNELSVTAYSDSMLGPDDYPSVGRWDREHNRKSNFIGLRCGAAWCEVHAKGQDHPSSPRYAREPGASRAEKRVFAIKGWYDEQHLADRAGGVFGPVKGLATLVPDPAIQTLTSADYTGQWKTVAYASISTRANTYDQKLNLGDAKLPPAGPHAALTRTEMCRAGTGRLKDCGAIPAGAEIPAGLEQSCAWNSLDATNPEYGWFARITDPRSGKITHRCVTRHDHSSFPHEIPGTARWMWLDNDETQWVRCDKGCCTVKA